MIEQFRQLCVLPGVSGDEKDVRDYLKQNYLNYTPTLISDRLGSLFAKKDGQSNQYKIMISANMDENGGIIQDILPNGQLSFLVIGTYDKQVFANQTVYILTRQHHVIKGITVTNGDNITIAVGAKDKKSVELIGIRIGDMVVLEGVWLKQNDIVYSKNLKNRASLFTGLCLLESLTNKELPFDTYIGGITHSVTGQRAAITITNTIKPDVAIVIDAAYVENAQSDTIYLRAFDKTMLPNIELLHYLKTTLTTIGYKIQEHVQLEGTDGSFIHKTLIGTPTIVITLPLLYDNVLLNAVELNAINTLKDALECIVTNLDESIIKRFLFEE